jgi:hypothetical protein
MRAIHLITGTNWGETSQGLYKHAISKIKQQWVESCAAFLFQPDTKGEIEREEGIYIANGIACKDHKRETPHPHADLPGSFIMLFLYMSFGHAMHHNDAQSVIAHNTRRGPNTFINKCTTKLLLNNLRSRPVTQSKETRAKAAPR